ncbi:Long-chain-fatty-acid--CoA ligase FadD15 [Pseudomonas fluorescens]|uniref:AMP-binding protein n=1 Tax=Pseudomonas azotoformans TaxID=47878 RepID=A0A4Q0HP67_PSEAZ|nr:MULTISPECIES: AMP-binding protein [Pseudomonas]KRP91627.1 AMP-binding protein [Pseudomonas lactis]KWV79452.1 Long-chain-fatty-acid--CoA ligase FadD15 [Pseudomonas fluorescens]MBJ2223313.1 AMP-binding protein [Pseudomonas sp. MF7451]MBJ2306005.1 AMP-binding protein [Pseudomonas sp. MF2846]MBK3491343.1 AMP-binding protein [Pseudomonas sp. MF2857]
MPVAFRLPLQVFFEREARHPRKVFLVQPIGGGEVQALTWGEVGHQARCAAHWLRARELPQGSHIALISKNCAHWIIADLAIWMAGHVSVPLYPNLTADSVAHVLAHSQARLALIGKLDDWSAMAPGVPVGVPTISLPLCPPEETFDFSWADLQACSPIQDNPLPDAASLATIIYTSGTTGLPKGVMHSFGALGFAASGGTELFGLGEGDRLLSYLPLCHVAERMFVEMASIYTGQTVFFAESLETFLTDLRRARPTALFGVPRIWTKFQLGVYAKIPEKRLDTLLRLPFIGKRVGHKILAGLGLDALRIALSGAAPVPEALLRWYQRLGMDVLEVYGMTENCGYSHVCRPGGQTLGWIGQPCPGVQVRIDPSGEVQVHSGATMLGYFKDPQKTADTLTADGFLRTGDKGEQDADGRLRLTGRLKEIFKTSKGKYVAPAPIENRLAEHARIEQVCVVGEGLSAPIGLCVLSAPGEDRQSLGGGLERWLAQVNAGLDKHERMGQLVVVKDQWAVENGFLTPTLKIKRNVIESTYGPQLQAWSARAETVLWQD